MHHPLIPFPEGCVIGTFKQRVKRFSVEIDVNGESVWIHSNNSGSMMGLLRKGARVLASPAANPARKLQWTQECVELQDHRIGPFWTGVNTSVPNKLLEAAFYAGNLEWAQGYTQYKREAKIGNSRLDARLDCEGKPTFWIECKNVTMVEDSVASFPDAISERAQKHLQEMIELVKQGHRAAFFYLIQRADGDCFGPADFIDPAYTKLFWQALDAGVEVYPHRALLTEQGIDLGPLLPLANRR